MQRVEVTQDFPQPVEQVYAFLAEHENLGPLFGAKVVRKKDGDTSRNGAGSVRRLRLGPGPWFEETVTAAVENELIEYRITQGSPLRGHRGVMRFSPTATGSRLHYVIELDAAVPGLAWAVKQGLTFTIGRALRRYAASA